MADKLTDWLEQDDLTDVSLHPVFGFAANPPGLKIDPLPECAGCPIVGNNTTQGHMSYHCSRLKHGASSIEEHNRIHTRWLREMQFVVDRLWDNMRRPHGSEQGFLYNGSATLNFASSNGFRIVSAEGKRLTVEIDSDPRTLTWLLYRFVPEDNIFYVYGSGQGPPQANDQVEFFPPSSFADKVWARVRRVELSDKPDHTTWDEVNGKAIEHWRVVLDMDKDMTGATWSTDVFNPEALGTVSVWRQAGHMKSHLPIFDLFPLKVHKRIKRFLPQDFVGPESYEYGAVRAEGWQNGRVELTRSDGKSGAAERAYPADESNGCEASLRVIKHPVGGGDPIDISALCYQRLVIEQPLNISEGSTETGAEWEHRTWLYLGDKDWHGNNQDDLLADAESITVEWFAEATPAQIKRGDYCVLGTFRCKHCRDDFSNSILGTTIGTATAAPADMPELPRFSTYCNRMVYKTSQIETADDGTPRLVEIAHEPTGRERFRGGRGRCYMPGVCDQFAPQRHCTGPVVELDAPFTVATHLGLLLQQLWTAIPVRIDQGIPGVSSYRNFTITRPPFPSGAPSLTALHGLLIPLTSPIGMHPLSTFPDIGGVFVGPATVGRNSNDDEYISAPRGAFEDRDTDLSAVRYGEIDTYPDDGVIGRADAEFGTKHDTIGNLWSDETDAWRVNRTHPYRSGLRIERDTGALRGRAASRWPKEISAPVLIPNVDFSRKDVAQERKHVWGTVEFWARSTPILYRGVEYSIEILIPRLQAPSAALEKTPTEVTSGTVAATHTLEGSINLGPENKPRRWSYLLVVGPGQSTDVIVEFEAGGLTARAADPAQVDSWYDPDKTLGGDDLAQVGDAIQFYDSDFTEWPGFRDRLFTIVAAEAHGGAPAPSWGKKRLILPFTVNGYWQADTRNLGLGDLAPAGILGVPSPESARAASNYSASDTEIALQSTAALRAGTYISSRRTGELMRVLANDDAIPKLVLERHVNGSVPTGEIHNGDWLDLEMVTDHATHLPYRRVPGDIRPEEINVGEYWLDPITGWILFNESDRGNAVDIAYYVAPLPRKSSNCYIESNYEIASNVNADYTTNRAVFHTVLLTSDHAHLQRKVVLKIFGEEIEYGEAGAPAAGTSYALETDAAGHMVLVFDLADAAWLGELTLTLEGDAPAPGDVAHMPGYGSTVEGIPPEWGKRRDVLQIQDDADGVLAALGNNLQGRNFRIWRNAQVSRDKTIELKITNYAEDSYEAVASSNYVWLPGYQVGKARLLLTKAWADAVEAQNPNRCLLL